MLLYHLYICLGLGPIYYGRFMNGRVEGYLDARALQPDEMSHPDIYPAVAKGR